MPICPRCNANIHAGAREQCPACGYSLTLQERVFGKADVTFPRVKDVAGVLTQQERETLMRYLANIERYIPPVALCVYLTNHGQSREFRAHAHWILNHANIHTPSFGQREAKRAIEDAELQELAPGEKRQRDDTPEESALTRFWHRAKELYQSRFSKCPPPVRPEWMLILVVDVQLKMACFSWGYMLDPYINPDKINSCITSARLQFRERARVAALEQVMNKAAKQLASNARRINKDIIKGKRLTSPLLAGVLGLSLLSAAPVCWAKPATPAKTAKTATPAKTTKTARPTQPAAPAKTTRPSTPAKPAKNTKPATPAKQAKPAPPAKQATPAKPAAPVVRQDEPEDVAIDDEETETVAVETPAVQPATPPATKAPATPPAAASRNAGKPASYTAAPVWVQEDHARLMNGELASCYQTLLPGGKVRPATAPKPRNMANESDEKVLGHYCQEYNRPTDAGLCDPQGLLSDMERGDVEQALEDLKKNTPFRIYAAVFKAGQAIPPELNANTLLSSTHRGGGHAVILLYSIGDTPEVAVGYKEFVATDDQRREWSQKVRDAATMAGGGKDGLIAALHCVREQFMPLAKGLAVDGKPPLVELEFSKKTEEKEPSFRDKIKAFLNDPENGTVLSALGVVAGVSVLVMLWFLLHRRVVRLMDTTPDVRLASPHGAGVSRYVRYLDGKEAPKDPQLF